MTLIIFRVEDLDRRLLDFVSDPQEQYGLRAKATACGKLYPAIGSHILPERP